jgi:hypothetical protein
VSYLKFEWLGAMEQADLLEAYCVAAAGRVLLEFGTFPDGCEVCRIIQPECASIGADEFGGDVHKISLPTECFEMGDQSKGSGHTGGFEELGV